MVLTVERLSPSRTRVQEKLKLPPWLMNAPLAFLQRVLTCPRVSLRLWLLLSKEKSTLNGDSPKHIASLSNKERRLSWLDVRREVPLLPQSLSPPPFLKLASPVGIVNLKLHDDDRLRLFKGLVSSSNDCSRLVPMCPLTTTLSLYLDIFDRNYSVAKTSQCAFILPSFLVVAARDEGAAWLFFL